MRKTTVNGADRSTGRDAPRSAPRLTPGPGAHVVVDASGIITSMSLGARLMLGYDENSRIDARLLAHIHSRNLLQIMRDVASMVCNGKPSAQWMARFRTSDATWIWVRLTAHRQGSTFSPTGILIALERLDA